MNDSSNHNHLVNALTFSALATPGQALVHPKFLSFTNWGGSCLLFLDCPMNSPSTYHVISLEVLPEHCELVQSKLYDLGCLGLEEEDKKAKVFVKAYFPEVLAIDVLLQTIKKDFPDLIKIEGATFHLSEKSFREIAFDPFEMIPSVWIVPPQDLQETKTLEVPHQIIIRPGMAFGTGRHETTALTAQALLDLKPTEASLLDIGTGSGILAMLAHQLGVKNVETIEIDADARHNAQENFKLNKIKNISIYENIDNVSSAYDIVLANILTPTILYLKDKILNRLNGSGILILSGITTEEAPQIRKTFQGLDLIKETTQDGWCCMTYQKD